MASAREDLCELLVNLMDQASRSPLDDRSYGVGVIGGMLEDLRPTGFYPDGAEFRRQVQPEWEALRQSVMAIFEDTPETARIHLPTRVAAAEALGQAGDPRLRLPKPGLGDSEWRQYWAEVPGGEFWMGAQTHTPNRPDYDTEASLDEDRADRNPVRLSAFLMGRFPVTVYEYEVYLQDRDLEPAPEMRFYQQLEYRNRPVVSITWKEAMAYCEWAGGRLPTEEEWEYAARGSDSLRYPWGNEPPAEEENNLANFGWNVGDASPVGLFPAGARTGLRNPGPGGERHGMDRKQLRQARPIQGAARRFLRRLSDESAGREPLRRSAGGSYRLLRVSLRARCDRLI